MRRKPIRMVLEGGGWGIGGAGCLVAVLLAFVSLFVRLPDIVPGPALLDTAVWVLGLLLLAVILEQASGLISPDKLLELDGDLLRVRRGRRVDWERRLPPASGFHLGHLVTPHEKEGREDDVFLIIEMRSGMGEPLRFLRPVVGPQRETIQRAHPAWEGPLPWRDTEADLKPLGEWIHISHTFDGDRMLEALLEQAGVTLNASDE